MDKEGGKHPLEARRHSRPADDGKKGEGGRAGSSSMPPNLAPTSKRGVKRRGAGTTVERCGSHRHNVNCPTGLVVAGGVIMGAGFKRS